MRERRHQMGLRDIQLEGPLSQEAVYAKRPGNRRLFFFFFFGRRAGIRRGVGAADPLQPQLLHVPVQIQDYG